MPTFERCPSCIATGKPADETPIVPEGSRCQRCEKIASVVNHHPLVVGVCDCGRTWQVTILDLIQYDVDVLADVWRHVHACACGQAYGLTRGPDGIVVTKLPP